MGQTKESMAESRHQNPLTLLTPDHYVSRLKQPNIQQPRPPGRGSTSSAATLSWREDRLHLSSEPGVQGAATPALKNGPNATVFSLP